jgi:uncharacterized protein
MLDDVKDLLDTFVEMRNYAFDSNIFKFYAAPQNYEGVNSTLVVTDECNLRCTYCYCNKEPNRMSWDTARDFIDYHFERTKDDHLIKKVDQIQVQHRIIWEFIGGEPLLEASLMFQCMEYITAKVNTLHDNHPWKRTDWLCECGEHDALGYRFMIGTNGLLLNDPSIQKQLLKYKNYMHIGVTLDGDQEMHDLCRKDTEGKGSFDRVMRAWVWLREEFPSVVTSTKSTIAHENLPHIYRIIKFFHKLEPDKFFLMQNCVFENVWWEGDQFVLFNQLCDVADFLIEGEKYKNFMIRWFDLNIFAKSTSPNNWCGASQEMNACDHTGTLFPCLRFKHIDNPYALGSLKCGIDPTLRSKMNLGNPIHSPKQVEIVGVDCFNCPISALCSECQAGAYNVFGRMDVKSPFICPMHRATVFANIYFFGKLMKFTEESDSIFRDYLLRLLEDYTKTNYFGFDKEGRQIEWKLTM